MNNQFQIYVISSMTDYQAGCYEIETLNKQTINEKYHCLLHTYLLLTSTSISPSSMKWIIRTLYSIKLEDDFNENTCSQSWFSSRFSSESHCGRNQSNRIAARYSTQYSSKKSCSFNKLINIDQNTHSASLNPNWWHKYLLWFFLSVLRL